MRIATVLLFLSVVVPGGAQMTSPYIDAAQLQAVLNLPLNQAVERRKAYKEPMRVAYLRQTGLVDRDCKAELARGQQAYNVCMGRANEEADRDYVIFFKNLQMLCRDQEQLKTMQSSEVSWKAYREGAVKAARAAWPDGTGAPAFSGEVYLTLLRDHISELNQIYGIRIGQ